MLHLDQPVCGMAVLENYQYHQKHLGNWISICSLLVIIRFIPGFCIVLINMDFIT